MAVIKLRSPRYETLTTPSGAVSARLQLSIDGVVRYTIIKSCVAGQPVLFEIAELSRDYLIPTVSLNSANYPENKIAISRVITFFDGANATGNVVSGGNTVAHQGVDGYGTFTEGSNPTISVSQFGFSKDHKNNKYEIFAPVGADGAYQFFDSSGDITTQDFVAGDTSDTQPFGTVTINRIDCTKYGSGRKIVFINKFGAIQELWFFLKEVQTTNVKADNYQRNIVSKSGSYDTKSHPIKTFDKQGKQTITLSSGYYPEFTNTWFEQLLLSEYCWMVRPVYTSPNNNEIVPIVVKTSNFTHKTSLNNKLINYTIQFEEAFDYINNVR
ncbi:MAG: hypothetical protein Unbinned306contig1002_34 [Prokaryotic dsDNA virus sp.]|nr:MAG: hypothetical protein Unbinned306contig1002_34 [Prokaryotic dsDNA virus sp.]|tara:strand:- start:11470 stop:12450 length:981 start_codon:yes stop_codon:yes gene_type:complete